MHIRVLGTLELLETAGDRSGVALRSPRLRRLLAALLARSGDVMSADRLVAAVWGEDLPADPGNALQILVSRLRRVLGPEPALLTRAPGYLLVPGATDADRFERLLAEARKDATAPARAAELLDEALGLWRGAAYAEFADEEFVRAEAARLEELRMDAEAERVDHALRLGREDDAIARLEPLVAAHPLRDRPRAQLMLALYRAGRQADALARYADYRTTLADELGIDPSQPLRDLQERILRQDPALSGPRRREPAGRAGNLPAPVTGLVGRSRDLAGIAAVLHTARVVTLTGPGGVGKTRLALAAAQAASGFADGVWLVDLAAVVVPESVPDAVVTALGVQRRRELSVTGGLVEYLRPLNLLLLLDNCEHVAVAAARLAETVAGSCPGVTILATSREPLATDGEHVHPVGPLQLPPPGMTDLDAVGGAAAVRLFVERATAASPGFALDATNSARVTELCRRLDGLPLALELAAPKLRAMNPSEIVDRLEERFALLRGGRATAPERHRTLRAVVDWSYELLDEPERAVFTHLTVFAGPFPLSAAETVCRRAGLPADVAAVVASLVDRSMLTADTAAMPTRYGMLETLRAYGRERLAGAGAEPVARRAHAEHAVSLAEAADRGLRGPEEGHWVDELIGATGDLRAAHLWALDRDVALAARLSAALVWFAKFHLPPEVPTWAEQTAETIVRHPPGEIPQLPVVLGVAAAGARARGDFDRAAELADRATAAGHRDGDPDLRYVLMVRSGLALFHGRLDTADRLADRAARLALDAGDPAWAAHAIANRSLAAAYGGDPGTAQRLADEAATVAAPTGNPTATGWAAYAAGEATAAADPERALALLERSRSLAVSVRNRYLGGVALVSAAALHGRRGDPTAALRRFAEVIEHWHRLGNRTQQWTTVRNVVELLCRLGADEHAAVLDAAVASRTTSAPAFGAAAARLDRIRDVLRERLGPGAYRAAVDRGGALSDDEVVALARAAVSDTAARSADPGPPAPP